MNDILLHYLHSEAFAQQRNLHAVLLSDSFQQIDSSRFIFDVDFAKIRRNECVFTEAVRFTNIKATWVLRLKCLTSETSYVFQPKLILESELFRKSQYQQYAFNLNLSSNERNILQTSDYFIICTPTILELSCNRFKLRQANNLTIKATVTIHCNSIISKMCANISQKLAENNIKLLSDDSYSDFTFIVEGKEFKVHKNILAASSPVFGKLFNCPMQESISNKCEVDHITSHTFDQMLHFIYGGIFPYGIDENTAMKLYEAADYYGIQELMDVSQEAIRSKLTNENAISIYVWSKLYHVKELKVYTKMNFNIVKNALSSPDLIKEIIEQKENELWMLKHITSLKLNK